MVTVFVLGFLLVVIVLHVYLYRRLVRDVTGGRVARGFGRLVLILLGASTVAAAMVGLRLPREPTTVLNWVGYLWLALALYLALVLAVLELPRLALNRREGRRTNPDRRRALARLLGATAAVVAAATVGYGAQQARVPRLVRREITLDRLDPALDRLSIAALADVHLGGINRGPFLADVVRRVNAEQPDLVAVVGDLIDGSVDELGAAAAPLAEVDAPTFFVTGNHEYFHHAEQWCEFLPTLGVRVLRNERVAVGRRGVDPAKPGAPTFDLAGIDDRTAERSGEPGHGANLDKALDRRDPARAVVLLAHQPVMIAQAARAGVDLQISGHTHGGQILPFGYLVALDQPVLAGLSRVGRTWLYVTRGVGFWGPPVRVGAPPEITLITLRTASR